MLGQEVMEIMEQRTLDARGVQSTMTQNLIEIERIPRNAQMVLSIYIWKSQFHIVP